MTASVMREDVARLAAAGFDGYVAKPIAVRAFPGQVAALRRGAPLSGREESDRRRAAAAARRVLILGEQHLLRC